MWEFSASRGPARLVLLAIADNAHDDGAQAWPSMTTLVRKTGLAERTVQGAVNRLVELGELEVVHNAGPRHTNLYRVLMTPAPEAPPQEMHPAGDAGVQEMHPTPAGDAPLPPQEMHPEPSVEPSRNRQKQPPADPPTPDRPGTLPTAAAVGEVWEAYLAARASVGLDEPRVRLTPKRRDKIRARLKAFPLADVVDAAWGWTRDPWPDRRLHCDAVQVFRSDEHVEKFRDLWRRGPPQVLGKATAQAKATYEQMRQWAGGDDGDQAGVGRDRGQAQRELPRPAG